MRGDGSGELMVTLELCRHPESRAREIERVEQYADELGFAGPELEIALDWIDKGVEEATADFDRFYGESLPALSEPSLREEYLQIRSGIASVRRNGCATA